jgi:hypothetical protein
VKPGTKATKFQRKKVNQTFAKHSIEDLRHLELFAIKSKEIVEKTSRFVPAATFV